MLTNLLVCGILFLCILSGSVVDCRQFINSGCLSFLVVSLCSCHEEVRAASGHALTRFLSHLEGAKFKEKQEVDYRILVHIEGILFLLCILGWLSAESVTKFS